MKKIIRSVLLIMLLLLAGCSPREYSSQSALDKEICPVVDRYLENAVAGNWPEVYSTLTGDALTSAKANTGQVKAAGEKIISREYRVSRTGDSLARVDVDFTKKTADGFDRLAYSFDLIKMPGERWQIYRTTWGDYLHDDLQPGQLPADAAGAIRTYLELTFADKRTMDNQYLAGRLLQESIKSKALPVDPKTYGVLQGTTTIVKSLECLGLSGDYAVVKVACSVTRDTAENEAIFLINAVQVNGTWKIAGIANL